MQGVPDAHSTTGPSVRPSKRQRCEVRQGAMLLNNLPDDELLQIFKQIDDAIEIVRIQRVCKRWLTLTRRTPTLFRNALYLEQGLERPTIRHLHTRLCKIVALSQGKVDKVGLKFGKVVSIVGEGDLDYDESEVDAAQDLFDTILPALPLRKLYLSMDVVFESSEQTEHIPVPRVEIGEWEDVPVVFVCVCKGLNAILHRFAPESLVLHLNIHEIADIEQEVFQSWLTPNALNLSQLRFLHLRVRGMEWPAFFGQVTDPQCYSQLTRLCLNRVDLLHPDDVRALYAMLEVVQESLVELSLDFLSLFSSPFKDNLDFPWPEPRTLVFRKLLKLHLSNYMDDDGQFLTYGEPVYHFSAPLLDTGLSLDCDSPITILNELMTPKITELCISIDTLKHAANIDAIRRCTELKRLSIVFRINDYSINNVIPDEALLARLVDVPFRDVALLAGPYFDFSFFETWIKRRAAKRTTRIEHVVFCDPSSIYNYVDRLDTFRRAFYRPHADEFHRIATLVPRSRLVRSAKEICSFFSSFHPLLQTIRDNDPTYDVRSEM